MDNSQLLLAKRINEIICHIMKSIGILGNLLMFIVYSHGNLHRMSVSVYFRAIAALVLFKIVFSYVITPLKRLVIRNELSFKLEIYLWNLLVPITVWLEVAVSVDRLFNILFPLKFKILKKPLAKCLLTAAVCLYNMSVYVYAPIKVTRYDPEGNLEFSKTLFLISLVNDSLLPFAIMFAMSIAIFVGVVRAHGRIKRSVGNSRSKRTVLKDIKFGVTMLVLNCVFFVCIGLYRVNPHISPFENNLGKAFTLTSRVFHLIIINLNEYYYYVIFYIQLGVNNLVRKELGQVFAYGAPFLRRFTFIRTSE